MILVGLGSNLHSTAFSSSEELLDSSINRLEQKGISVVGQSSWYRSAPVPASDQPWFVNGVIRIETGLDPKELLRLLHVIEGEYGRMRVRRNESRTLDLDLLAYGERVIAESDGLKLPHPRLQDRAFVLMPLAELAPQWRHPVTGLRAEEMLEAVGSEQQVERLD